jgi:hypothetical protein
MSHPAMGAQPAPVQIITMIGLIDWWETDRPSFEGERCLADAADANCSEASGHAVARLFVLHAAAAAIRDGETVQKRYLAKPYVAALFAFDDPEAGALWECLAAIRLNDITWLASRVLEVGGLCARRNAPQTARSFGELAYEAALATGTWVLAHHAALLLERLAELDESPASAERWARRAGVHGRRMTRYGRRL